MLYSLFVLLLLLMIELPFDSFLCWNCVIVELQCWGACCFTILCCFVKVVGDEFTFFFGICWFSIFCWHWWHLILLPKLSNHLGLQLKLYNYLVLSKMMLETRFTKEGISMECIMFVEHIPLCKRVLLQC